MEGMVRRLKCPNCKKKIRKKQKFCNHCGMEIRKKESKKSKMIFLPVGAGCICLLGIMVSVFLLPKTTSANRLQEKLDMGNKYLKEADYKNAEIAFNEALKIDEKSPDAAMGLADTYSRQKKPDKALKYLEKASENMQGMSVSDAGKYVQKWKSNEEYYQSVCKNVIDSQSNQDKNTAETAGNMIIYIVTHTNPIVNITPTPEIVKEPEGAEATKPSEPEEKPEISEAPTMPEIQEEPEVPGATPTPEIIEESEESEITPIPDMTEGLEESEQIEEESAPEVSEEPEESDDIEVQEDALVPEEVLADYAKETILTQMPYMSQGDISTSYNYEDEAGSIAQLNGTLGIECRDFNGDGEKELLVISLKNGKIMFDMYTEEDGTAVLKGTGTASDGISGILESADYKGLQECFIKENGNGYYVGIVEHYIGVNAGDGSSCAKVFTSVYSIGTDGSVSSVAAASNMNGVDPETFMKDLSSIGLSGSWINEGIDNPDLLSAGVSTKENGVEDLVFLTNVIENGSGTMYTNIKNHTTFE